VTGDGGAAGRFPLVLGSLGSMTKTLKAFPARVSPGIPAAGAERACREKTPLAGAYFFVIPGWSVGPGPEPMNTGHSQLAEVRVPGFRALGLRSSPGMTRISDFLTTSFAGEAGEIGVRVDWAAASF